MKTLKKIKIGILGFSKKNGHPYSFSAIFNGYNKKLFKKTGYPQILKYLNKKRKKDFGIHRAKVTHAWSQSYFKTKILCRASLIKFPIKKINDLVDNVDAAIIARDDWKSHYMLAKNFLKKKKPIFIDKPLSLNLEELKFFKKYINSSLLMSTSSLRYSNELESVKKFLKTSGKVRFIVANVPNDVTKYGVHVFEFISSLGLLNVLNIRRVIKKQYDTYLLELSGNIILIVNCLGDFDNKFDFTFYCEKKYFFIKYKDNFSSFKKTLQIFVNMIIKRKNSILYKDTLSIMKIIKKAKTL